MTVSEVLKLLGEGGQPHWAWNPLDYASVLVLFVFKILGMKRKSIVDTRVFETGFILLTDVAINYSS
jgi:hypothetical protein